MTQPILPNKTYLFCHQVDAALIEKITQLGDKLGFICLELNNKEEFEKRMKEVAHLAGILIFKNEELASNLRASGQKVLYMRKSVSPEDVVQQLDHHLCEGLPINFLDLAKNLVNILPAKLLSVEFSGWKRSLDFGFGLNYWAICDSIASGLILKASCEINLDRMQESGKTNQQVKDAAGEICNQILGAINTNLRKIGLVPMISLPISAHLNADVGINQWEYIPFVRFIDADNSIAIGLLIQIDRKCTVNWEKLSTEFSPVEVEFF